MARDVSGLIQELEDRGELNRAMNDPRAQFAINGKTYWGATVLPVRPKMSNMFREYGVKWRSIVANDGTRYSPVTLRQGARTGSVVVELGEKDAGSQIYGEDLENIRRLLNGGELAGAPGATAAAQTINLMMRGTLQPQLDKEEKERLEAMVDGVVYRRGDNSYQEDVPQANPLGHRITVADAINDPTFNPLEALDYQLSFMRSKGYPVTEIRTSTRVINAMRNNPEVTKAVGSFTYVNAQGQIVSGSNRVSLEQINAFLAENGDGYPPIRAYDETYETVYGTRRFLRENAMLMVSTRAIDAETIRMLTGESALPQPTSLGYFALGIAENQSAPGRVAIMDYFDRDRGARVDVKGWSTSGPVITAPEALSVLNWQFDTDEEEPVDPGGEE